ncbi:histidine phosphatase family protein [Pseudaminobacter arsenicus]|uniref:Histidine phosphatase family protein n=1 Tax=Borborobacter arsenicus TaxID=1851146 RepID=A0A432V515_9HYPH|nr:histidine phosphatase family protein [Pseudaminobacter arsenicus]RUM97241.1 histidine phosphatase family protein [Pseudaminobacter arsenicus]
MSPLVYFVRHGQTIWNAEKRFQGQADTDMTERGRSQADRNGRRLAELIDRPEDFDFVASPLRRTRETMERIRIAMGLPPEGYRTDPRLIEVHFGDWQGLTFAELEARHPGSTKVRALDKWRFVPPGLGESYQMLLERVQPWFEKLERPTVCVTHGGVIRAMFRLVEAMPSDEAAALEVVQDRVLRFQDGKLTWL